MTFVFYFKNAGMPIGITENGIMIQDDKNGVINSNTYSDIPGAGIIVSVKSLINSINDYFPLLIAFWLTGVFIISVRMTGGIYLTHKLRKSCLHEIPEELHNRFLHLVSMMNIRKKVNINGSSLVEVPSAIGFFKPLILIPLCAISQMPADQLEAIIAHELAHIRRHDYLVNLFQSVMEALFFYHPVIRLIQKHIRKERENCCDDMALSYSQGQITYIKALTSIQELPALPVFPLLAINSDRNYLMTRIIRILKKEKMRTNFKDKLIAGFILLSAIVIILLNTGGKFISFHSDPDDSSLKDQNVQVREPLLAVNMTDPIPLVSRNNPVLPEHVTEFNLLPDVTPPAEINRDTSLKVKDNVIQRTIIKDGKETDIKMKVEKGEVTELYVDGKKIPESGYGKYQPEIDKTMKDLQMLERELTETNQKLNQFEIQFDMEEIRKEMEENMREMEQKIKEIDVEAMIENIEIPEIDQEKIKQEIEKAIQEIEAIDMEKIREEMEFAMQDVCEEMKNIEFPDMNEVKMEMEKAMQELKEIDREKIEKEIQEAMQDIQIDKEELQQEIEKSLQEIKEYDMQEIKREMENERMKMEEEKIRMEEERMKMNEMLEEIEKLELEK